MENIVSAEVMEIMMYAADNFGLDFRDDYSGRGMFGKTTCGVVGSMTEIAEFLQAVGSEFVDAGIAFQRFEFDSMGRDTICYVK